MRTLTIVLLACVGLSGCVVVPVDPVPEVYVAPPPVFVQPYFYYRSDRYYRRR